VLVHHFLYQMKCDFDRRATDPIVGNWEVHYNRRPTPFKRSPVKEVPMRTANGLHMLLVTTVLCWFFQTAAAQPSAKNEVLAVLAERDKAFVAGDEMNVAQGISEDYLQTDVSGHVQDKQAWLNEYFRPLAPSLRSGATRLTTFERSDIVVRDFGCTVVVAGKLMYKFAGVNPWNPKVTFQPGPPRVIRFTAVWIKREGAWKMAVLHKRNTSGVPEPSSYGS
jgi:hypothetical protein